MIGISDFVVAIEVGKSWAPVEGLEIVSFSSPVPLPLDEGGVIQAVTYVNSPFQSYNVTAPLSVWFGGSCEYPPSYVKGTVVIANPGGCYLQNRIRSLRAAGALGVIFPSAFLLPIYAMTTEGPDWREGPSDYSLLPCSVVFVDDLSLLLYAAYLPNTTITVRLTSLRGPWIKAYEDSNDPYHSKVVALVVFNIMLMSAAVILPGVKLIWFLVARSFTHILPYLALTSVMISNIFMFMFVVNSYCLLRICSFEEQNYLINTSTAFLAAACCFVCFFWIQLATNRFAGRLKWIYIIPSLIVVIVLFAVGIWSSVLLVTEKQYAESSQDLFDAYGIFQIAAFSFLALLWIVAAVVILFVLDKQKSMKEAEERSHFFAWFALWLLFGAAGLVILTVYLGFAFFRFRDGMDVFYNTLWLVPFGFAMITFSFFMIFHPNQETKKKMKKKKKKKNDLENNLKLEMEEQWKVSSYTLSEDQTSTN